MKIKVTNGIILWVTVQIVSSNFVCLHLLQNLSMAQPDLYFIRTI